MKNKKILFITVTILFLTLLTFTTYCYTNTKSFQNIYYENINLSNLTKTEIQEKVQNSINDKEISFYLKEKKFDIDLTNLNLKINSDDIAEKAFSIGRDSNFLKDYFIIIKSFFKKTYITGEYEYNEEELKKIFNEIEMNLDNKFIETNIFIDEELSIAIIDSRKRWNNFKLWKFQKWI